METFTYPIEIANFESRHSRRIDAIVNTGVFFTIASSRLLRELAIEPTETRADRSADGLWREVSIGHASVTVDGRSGITIVEFGDDSVPLLLGRYTLNGLALAPDPNGRRFVSLEPLPLF